MTLTLNQHDQIFCSANRLAIVNICTKYQNPSRHVQDMERTRNVTDRRMDGRTDGQTDGQHKINMPPPYMGRHINTISITCSSTLKVTNKIENLYNKE